MINIKEYAKKSGISYEAARQQVNRYREELGAHIIKQGRTQYLDAAGVDILDGKRRSSVAVISSDATEAAELRRENKNLLIKLAELQAALLKEQAAHLEDIKKLAELEADKANLLEADKQRGLFERLFRRK